MGSYPKKFEAKVPLFLGSADGLSVDQQKLLFAYFTETHEAEVAEAKARGTFDEGVVSLSAESVAMSDGTRAWCTPTSPAAPPPSCAGSP